MTTYRIAFADQRTTPPKLVKVDVVPTDIGRPHGDRTSQADAIARQAVVLACFAIGVPSSKGTAGVFRTVPSHCRVLP